MITCRQKLALLARGYKLTFGEPKPPWRGYPKERKHVPILAERNGKTFYVTRIKNRDGIDAVILKQGQLPHMARIKRRMGSLVLTELVAGLNLWELNESDRPPLQEVELVLKQFAHALEKASIVHADLRPWNVLYSPGDQRFAVIDWGHCYQLSSDPTPCHKHLKACGHLQPFQKVDYCDLARLLEVLQEPGKAAFLWKMKRPPNWIPEKWVL